MDPQEEAVNQAEPAPATEQLQQTEGQEAQVAAEENVQQDDSQVQGQVQLEAVDENGVPYKNRYMETQRKLAELSENLPKIIQDTLAKQTAQAPKEKEYSIEELERIAIANPDLRPQVEAEKYKLLQAQTARQIEERDRKLDQQRQADAIRMRAEQEVMNDPAFKDCFIKTPTGQAQWNLSHPMTRIIGEIMQSPELSSRPDGLKIASDIAYGRYMREVAVSSVSKTRQLQAQVKKEQKKTLVEGGVSGGSQSSGDGFTKARAELAKTGSKKAAQTAILEYMKIAGLGKR